MTGLGEVLTWFAVETGRQAQTQGAGFGLGTMVYALLAAMVWFSRRKMRALVLHEDDRYRNFFLARAYFLLALVGVVWTWLASTAAMAARTTQGMQTGRHVLVACPCFWPHPCLKG